MKSTQPTQSKVSIFFLALIAMTLFVLSIQSEQYSANIASEEVDPNNPYIWWYADTYAAFVVERADGSDSRFIATGINPEENNVFEDAAFSPSGEWFAWRSEPLGQGGPFNFQGHIVRVEDNTELDLLDGIEDILSMKWSPTHDWLFIAYRDNISLRLIIVDVNNDEILAQANFVYDLGLGISDSHYDAFTWSVDGEQAYFRSGSNRIVLDGQGRIDVYPLNSIHASSDEFIVHNTANREYDGERWQTTRNTVLENLSTGQQIIIEGVRSRDITYEIYANPFRTYALIEIDNGREILLVDLITGTVTNILRTLDIPYYETRSVCDSWWSCWESKPLWSSDGRYALLSRENSSWYLVDATTSNVEEILPPETEVTVEQWHWVNQNQELIFMNEDPFEVYLYSITTGELNAIPVSEEGYHWQIFPSPDGRYLGRTSYFGLFDTETGEQSSWVEHSASQCCGDLLRVDWHENSDWFFTTDDTLYAGGGAKPSARSLHHIDGSRRELGNCFGTCIGYLPDHIRPHLLIGSEQSVVQEPILELLHDGEVYGVIWSPDGTQVMSYEYERGEGAYLSQWYVDDEQPYLIERHPIDFNCNPHPFGCRLIWDNDDVILLNDYSEIAVYDIVAKEIISVEDSPDPQYLHSPNGMYMLSGLRDDNPITLRNAETDEALFELETDSVNDVAWASDNETLLISDSETTYLWDGSAIHELEPEGYIYEIDYHSDTGLLVGGSFLTRVYVWDVANGRQLTALNWNAREMAFSPDGSLLATAGTQYVTIWDVSKIR